MIYKLNATFTWIFFQYFQLIAAIPSCLRKTAQEIAVTKRDLYFSDNRPISLTINWDVRTTIIYFRRVKLQSPLLLNAGLASFFSLPLVENSHSIQFINQRRTISMCNRIDRLFIGYITTFLWLESTKYSSKNMSP